MDWSGWLDKIGSIERAHPEKRVVAVTIPGGLPPVAWNVEANLYRGHVPIEGNVPNMREGVYASFPVTDGAFAVRFNTGEIVT